MGTSLESTCRVIEPNEDFYRGKLAGLIYIIRMSKALESDQNGGDKLMSQALESDSYRGDSDMNIEIQSILS